jgi:hypothetical protein
MSLIFNSIISSFHSALNGFWSLFYGVSASVHIVDWKHYPHADIYLEHYVSTVGQLYAEDIQVGVKYTRNRNGAILGYLDDDALIDVTNYIAHVTLEGTIIIWGRDDDPYGIFCVVIPFNCTLAGVIGNVTLSVEGSGTIWQPTNVPNHWFMSSPKISIDVKWNRQDSFPYVDTTYTDKVASRYDDKWYEPTFILSGSEVNSYTLPSSRLNTGELNKQLDQAALYIGLLKYKYETYPLTLGNFRKSAVYE